MLLVPFGTEQFMPAVKLAIKSLKLALVALLAFVALATNCNTC